MESPRTYIFAFLYLPDNISKNYLGPGMENRLKERLSKGPRSLQVLGCRHPPYMLLVGRLSNGVSGVPDAFLSYLRCEATHS